eukprot:3396986-Pleurochrysis_carterae.AAC.2
MKETRTLSAHGLIHTRGNGSANSAGCSWPGALLQRCVVSWSSRSRSRVTLACAQEILTPRAREALPVKFTHVRTRSRSLLRFFWFAKLAEPAVHADCTS